MWLSVVDKSESALLFCEVPRGQLRAGRVLVETVGSDLMKLRGEVAIVTAATKGIGFAIAKRFAQEGATVVISSRKQENVDEAVNALQKEGLVVFGMVCHVGDEKQRQALVSETLRRYGKIDILVNNAAVNPSYGPLIETSVGSWDKVFDINLKAPFLMTCEVAKHMVTRKKGAILFVSSIAGLRAMPQLGPYSVSKTAMLGLSNALASELATTGVRVNSICPGIIKTAFSQLLWQNPTLLAMVPMGRFGEADEVAGLAAFLCSSDASYVTGEQVAVSGGASRL